MANGDLTITEEQVDGSLKKLTLVDAAKAFLKAADATAQAALLPVVPDSGGTFSGNLTLNGTANTAPNQTAASGSSLMTRDLSDARYASALITASSTATISRNSTTTVTADSALVLPSVPIGTYSAVLFAQVYQPGAGGGGVRFIFATSGTATASRGQIAFGSGLVSVNTPLTTEYALANWGEVTLMLGVEFLLTVTVAGNLEFRWAQQTSTASNTSFFGRYLVLTKIG
jgi:hypothetical protein